MRLTSPARENTWEPRPRAFLSAWQLPSVQTPLQVCALAICAQECPCATAALCQVLLLPGAHLIYLFLSGVEGQVANIQRGGRLQALLELLLTAVEAAVAVLRDDWVKLLRAAAGGVSRRAALVHCRPRKPDRQAGLLGKSRRALSKRAIRRGAGRQRQPAAHPYSPQAAAAATGAGSNAAPTLLSSGGTAYV